MPAVVRVKRRIDEESVPALVLNGKKRRLENGSTLNAQPSGHNDKDEISTVLKFAGTMHKQDDTAISHYARLTKDEARALVQQKSRGGGKPSTSSSGTPNHTERARAEMRQSLHESRFRVVNCLRTTLAEGGDEELTIVDIEKHEEAPSSAAAAAADATQANSRAEVASTSSAAAAAAAVASVAVVAPAVVADSDAGYVYDFYLPENEQHAEAVDLMDDNYLSVRAFDDLIYEDHFNNDEDDVYDSEDSNQENQPGNEYPDEDDDGIGGDESDESEGTRQVRLAVGNFVFDDDDDDVDILSSDDEDVNPYEDPYVHTIDLGATPPEFAAFADDVDLCDVNRYGLAYARYKKRILKRLKDGDAVAKDDDDEEEEGDDCVDVYSDDKRSNSSSSVELYHSASENESFTN